MADWLSNPAEKKISSTDRQTIKPPTAAIILMLFGVLFSIFAVLPAWLEWARLSLDGQPTQATVTDLQSTGGRAPSYYVSYQFEGPDGNGIPILYGSKVLVSEQTYAQLSLGQTISIEYVRRAPAVSNLAGSSPMMIIEQSMITVVGIMSLALLIVLLLLHQMNASRSMPSPH